jgi:hypothetical protein
MADTRDSARPTPLAAIAGFGVLAVAAVTALAVLVSLSAGTGGPRRPAGH